MSQNTTYDVVITGGGIMGSSTAYHLLRHEPRLKVAVVERDPTYARASTTLSMSNVRVQFSLRENILISRHALQVLKTFETDMAVEDRTPRIYFHHEGNLFLVSEATRAPARQAFDLQRSLGCPVEWWTPQQIREHYPLYEPGPEIVAATFCPEDGHFDAYAVLMAYKAKARSLGADYLTGDVVRDPDGSRPGQRGRAGRRPNPRRPATSSTAAARGPHAWPKRPGSSCRCNRSNARCSRWTSP